MGALTYVLHVLHVLRVLRVLRVPHVYALSVNYRKFVIFKGDSISTTESGLLSLGMPIQSSSSHEIQRYSYPQVDPSATRPVTHYCQNHTITRFHDLLKFITFSFGIHQELRESGSLDILTRQKRGKYCT